MYCEKVTNLKEVRHVLEKLNKEAQAELKKLFGNDYKNVAFQIIRAVKNEKYLIRLAKTNEPVGVFGIIPQGVNEADKVGGIFFLTTDNLHKGNKIKLLKGAKRQIAIWEKEYSLIMDSCHKDNKTVAKWLHLLGFKPSKFEDNSIQIYYKGNIELYKG